MYIIFGSFAGVPGPIENSIFTAKRRKSAKFSEAGSRKTAKKRVFGAKKAAEIRKNAFLFH